MSLKDDDEIVSEAMQQNVREFTYASEYFKAELDMLLDAVKINFTVLEFVARFGLQSR